jgi:hypothetical protein
MEQDILTNKPEPPAHIADARMAMRMPSFVVFLASSWFLGMPILYYGVSQDARCLNFWIVGTILLCTSALRLWFPLATVSFAWFNAFLGVWAFISPYILGYGTGVTVNTDVLALLIIGMSIASAKAWSYPGSPIATAYEDHQALRHHDYPDIGPDRSWDRF